jgi:hypothetical protein
MLTEKQYLKLSSVFGIPRSSVKAIEDVESGGSGFDSRTGKIKIQFEPRWFKKLSRLTEGFWSGNKVDVQSQEWLAFNDAFYKNPNKAMESTSIGSMQVMGFHYARLGFKSVGAMWDFAKISEYNQLWLGLKFLSTDRVLYKAILSKDWKEVARRYNGSRYWVLGYDKKLRKAEIKHR